MRSWRDTAMEIKNMTDAGLIALARRCSAIEMCGTCPVYAEEQSMDESKNCVSVLLGELAARLENKNTVL